jgi:indole-3-glycerol phosphate synthase
MINKLQPILLQKQQEVALIYEMLQQNKPHPIAKLLRGELQLNKAVSFKNALQAESISVIAEIKRKSPSKGMLAPIPNPVDLVECYISGGARAISIVTDQLFFGGHLNDLMQVANHFTIPILRKDFIIDQIQIAQAAYAGANAVLLIVAVVGEKTKSLIEFAHSLQLDVVVEIHERSELQIALDAGANIIGINNRNLKTFTVDNEYALKIVATMPHDIIKIAESGITHPSLVKQYYEAGFDAVLIGETLVKSTDPKRFIEECYDCD